MNTVKSSTIIKKGCTNMKTVANTLILGNNAKTMDKIDKEFCMNIFAIISGMHERSSLLKFSSI